jgi:hypothetical protein
MSASKNSAVRKYVRHWCKCTLTPNNSVNLFNSLTTQNRQLQASTEKKEGSRNKMASYSEHR